MFDSLCTRNRYCPRHQVITGRFFSKQLLRLLKFSLLLTCILLSQTSAEAAVLSSTIETWIPTTGLDLTLNSAVFYGKANAQNLTSLRSEVVNAWVMPNGVVSGTNALITDFASIGSMGLSGSQIQPYQNLVSTGQFALLTGYDVYQLHWTLSNAGLPGIRTFTTIGYEDGNGNAVFEPWLYQTPVLGSPYIRTKNSGSSVTFQTKNGFGFKSTSGGAVLTIDCNANPVQCDVLLTNSSIPLWESVITHEEISRFTKNGYECCSSIIHFGFSNGFKSINVGGDKFSLELEGSFGWGGTAESKIVACCPEPSMTVIGSILGLCGFVAKRRMKKQSV